MNYVTLKNVAKSYGDRLLFKDVEFYINKGEKIGLIARNGQGKTTLLNIIAGEEPKEGVHSEVQLHPGITVAYLKQDLMVDAEQSVKEYIYASAHQGISDLYQYHLAVAEGDEKAIAHHLNQVEANNAWSYESKINEVLSKLKLEDQDQLVSKLSGGQQKRLSLAKILIEEPDLLILDEPTNHLDLDMIQWLEEYLQNPSITLLLITHDRYFLDIICDSIYELDNQSVEKYSGNYSAYLEKKAHQTSLQSIERRKAKKRFSSELEWMRRQPKARTTKAKSRIESFYQIKEELNSLQEEKELQLFIKPERLGSKIINYQYVSKAFGERQILKDFNYKFAKKDRVGIIGPNGSGKTTFLDLMNGIRDPDSGKIIMGETVKIGYYTQDGMQLTDHKTVLDTVREVAEYIPLEKGKTMSAVSLLEHFLFDRDRQKVQVSKLSGGEKRRLHLLTILMQNPNVLILDEPTNDLDIYTLQVLEDYLADFPGVLIVVSHDRFFLDKIVDHLFVFDTRGYKEDFPGNYRAYRDRIPEQEVVKSDSKNISDHQQIFQNNKEINRKIKAVENKINKLEKRRDELNALFMDQSYKQEDLPKLQAETKEIQDNLSANEQIWLELIDQLA